MPDQLGGAAVRGRARRRERGVLTARVAGHHGGPGAEQVQGGQGCPVRGIDREHREAQLEQRRGVGVLAEDEPAGRDAGVRERGVQQVEPAPGGGQLAAQVREHPGMLGALAGEDVGEGARREQRRGGEVDAAPLGDALAAGVGQSFVEPVQLDQQVRGGVGHDGGAELTRVRAAGGEAAGEAGEVRRGPVAHRGPQLGDRRA